VIILILCGLFVLGVCFGEVIFQSKGWCKQGADICQQAVEVAAIRGEAPVSPVTERDKAKNKIEETHQLLENLAREAETEALSKCDEYLAAAKEEYERDVAGFRFESTVFGDFLNISIARLGNPTEPKNQFFFVETPEPPQSLAINLRNVRAVRLTLGHTPSLEGELSYGYVLKQDDGKGTRIGGTNFGNYSAPIGSHWEVRPGYPYIPYSRPLVYIEKPKEKHEHCIDLSAYDYSIKFTTKNYAAAAKDDTIYFEGARITLYVPAGKGKEVHDQILAATGTREPV
jgi:hypothetical protein